MSEIQQFDPQTQRRALRTLLTTPKVKSEIQSALGQSVDVDQYVRVALTAHARGNKGMLSANTTSILAALMQAAQMGLSVDPLVGEGYIIARRNKHQGGQYWADFQFGYRGLIRRAMRHPAIEMVDCGVVYCGDVFEFQEGTNPELIHRRNLERSEEPAVLCTYAIVHFAGEGQYKRIHVSPKWEAEKARALAGDDGIWDKHFAAMARKTAVKRLLWTCPMDPDTRAAMTREALMDDGDYIDVPADDVEFVEQGEGGKPGSLDELKKQVRAGQ